MLTLLFIFLLLSCAGGALAWTLKATWGLAKILLAVILFPITLIVGMFSGLLYLAIPILLVVGAVALFKRLDEESGVIREI